jgi:hypothetical protein
MSPSTNIVGQKHGTEEGCTNQSLFILSWHTVIEASCSRYIRWGGGVGSMVHCGSGQLLRLQSASITMYRASYTIVVAFNTNIGAATPS